ncbi:MAG: hypothetical protein JSW65_01280 [Candidatus Bipolaricaulota bacterium]|nr:MAG: hypothetical protein JSW65_01280 [Candidatus Bipolaricaulota bacterium]
MALVREVRWGMAAAWILAVALMVVLAILRVPSREAGPEVCIVSLDGFEMVVALAEMKRLRALSRPGSYENQFGNWRDEGRYTGVLLADLIGEEVEYGAVLLVAADGYRIEVARSRLEDPGYPMIVAYAFDGVEIPAWRDGPRIAVLPEDGGVSNEEYGVLSAGSFWVKNVTEIHLLP